MQNLENQNNKNALEKTETQKQAVETQQLPPQQPAQPMQPAQPSLQQPDQPAKKEEPKTALIFNPNKPPLALVHNFQKIERIYNHSDLERIYRLKIGKRKGLDIWVVDGAKVRKELYTDFIFGGNDQRYKFIPFGEIWIDNAISVEELEFTIIHETYERGMMINGLTYSKAHELATQEELKARINKTESIDELRERWYKAQENSAKEGNGRMNNKEKNDTINNKTKI